MKYTLLFVAVAVVMSIETASGAVVRSAHEATESPQIRLVCRVRTRMISEPTPQTANQEGEIAGEIARLGSSSKSEREAAMKALVKAGKAAVPALVNALSDPRNDVRAFAAEALRPILAAEPAGAPNYHEKAYWEQRVAQLKAGMTLDEALKVLLPELSPAERRKTRGMTLGSGGGTTSTYRLDDHWTVTMYSLDEMRDTARRGREGLQYNFNEVHERGRLGSTPPVLSRWVNYVWVKPPAGYTGLWVTWYVNGQKADEIQYRNGQRDGTLTRFYEDGSRCFQQHYMAGTCHGTDTGWYRSGRKHYEGSHEHGEQTGTWRWWKENGQIESVKEYEKGKPIKKTGQPEG